MSIPASKQETIVVPLVSICVQTYQQEKYIGQCLESLLAQQCDFPFEIILGEDHSTDQTRAICHDFAAKYPNTIRLFLRDKKDKIFIRGQKTGRSNFLANLKAAKGKYITLCDGDDYWINDRKLQLQVDFMEKHPEVGLTYSSLIQESSDHIEKIIPAQDQIYTAEELKKEHFLGHGSTWIFRNDLDELFANPIIYKSPFLDVVIFYYFKMRSKIASQSFISSFYRFNTAGIYRIKNKKQRHADLLYMQYCFYRYFHHDLAFFLRSGIFYHAKKYLQTLIKDSHDH
ncbi:MAG: glycosyltransferase involved in cell wall biosynthesis [Algoriphagus sp.]|jgi:glycosyltransferase involved in cell wall biosynthesis